MVRAWLTLRSSTRRPHRSRWVRSSRGRRPRSCRSREPVPGSGDRPSRPSVLPVGRTNVPLWRREGNPELRGGRCVAEPEDEPVPGSVPSWARGSERTCGAAGRSLDAGRRRCPPGGIPRSGARPPRPYPTRGVRHVRPSRFGVPRCVQRGAHPGHHRGDLPLSRQSRDRRAVVHRPRHPRPVGAGDADRARGPRRARCRCPRRRGRRLHPDAGGVARDPRGQPGRGGWGHARAPGGRHRRDAVAQPARRRRVQVQPAQRWSRRHRRHRLDPGRGQSPARGRRQRWRRGRPADPVRRRTRRGPAV